MSVPFLVNENFPAPSVAKLRLAGCDVLSIAESYSGMDDSGVLSLAARESRWLVTFDRDYGELIFARGLNSPPAVILFRVASYLPEEPADGCCVWSLSRKNSWVCLLFSTEKRFGAVRLSSEVDKGRL